MKTCRRTLDALAALTLAAFAAGTPYAQVWDDPRNGRGAVAGYDCHWGPAAALVADAGGLHAQWAGPTAVRRSVKLLPAPE